MQSTQEMREHLVNKAQEDGDFRSHLFSDPRAAIEGEFDVTLPDGVSVSVHEESAEHVHLVLPPSPALSEEELRTVSGGFTSVGGPIW